MFEGMMLIAGVVFPLTAIFAILEGRRTLGIISIIIGCLAIFLYASDIGSGMTHREASRQVIYQIDLPLHRILNHMEALSVQGRTNELAQAFKLLSEYKLRLNLGEYHPKSDLRQLEETMNAAQK